MASREQTNKDAFHDIVLAHDDFGDFPADGIQPVDGELERSFGSHLYILEQREAVLRDPQGQITQFAGPLSV